MAVDEETEDEDEAVAEYDAQQEEDGSEDTAGDKGQETSGEEEKPDEQKKEPPEKHEQEPPAPVVQQIVATPEQAKKLDGLLKDAASLLSAIKGQLRSMDESIKTLPKECDRLKDASAQISCIANAVSDDLKKQCLEKYQKILDDVAQNFNRLVHDADKWQKQHEAALHKRKVQTDRIQRASAIVTPVLLLAVLALLLWKQ